MEPGKLCRVSRAPGFLVSFVVSFVGLFARGRTNFLSITKYLSEMLKFC